MKNYMDMMIDEQTSYDLGRLEVVEYVLHAITTAANEAFFNENPDEHFRHQIKILVDYLYHIKCRIETSLNETNKEETYERNN